MRKAILVALVSNRTGLSKKQSAVVVDTVFSAIIKALSVGESVKINGFGVFEVRGYDARHFRNPRTGEIFPRLGYKRPWFRASKMLKARVNGK